MPQAATAGSAGTITIAGVALSHPDRVLWPDQGATKRALAEHYERLAERMLPHVAGRPLTLVRCPRGSQRGCFIQRNAGPGFGKAIRQLSLRAAEKTIRVPVVDGLDGLIALVQIGVLEIHPWGARVDAPDRCDRLVFDLDPGEGVDWPDVVRAALAVRDRLAAFGLESFAKTTGGRGLHVVAPLDPGCGWDAAARFSGAVAEAMAAEEPDRYTTAVAKGERAGRILVDVLRNRRGASAVAPWSARARPGATVSTPLPWDWVSPRRTPDRFTVSSLPDLLGRLGDPWEGFGACRQTVDASLLRKAGARE